MRTLKALMAAVLLPAAVAAQSMIGEEALDFTLESLDGEMVTLSQLRGQVVMLNFFGYS